MPSRVDGVVERAYSFGNKPPVAKIVDFGCHRDGVVVRDAQYQREIVDFFHSAEQFDLQFVSIPFAVTDFMHRCGELLSRRQSDRDQLSSTNCREAALADF